MYNTSYVMMSFAASGYFRLLVLMLHHITGWSICFHGRPVDCLISASVAEDDKHSPSAVLVHAPAAQFPFQAFQEVLFFCCDILRRPLCFSLFWRGPFPFHHPIYRQVHRVSKALSDVYHRRHLRKIFALDDDGYYSVRSLGILLPHGLVYHSFVSLMTVFQRVFRGLSSGRVFALTESVNMMLSGDRTPEVWVDDPVHHRTSTVRWYGADRKGIDAEFPIQKAAVLLSWDPRNLTAFLSCCWSPAEELSLRGCAQRRSSCD